HRNCFDLFRQLVGLHGKVGFDGATVCTKPYGQGELLGVLLNSLLQKSSNISFNCSRPRWTRDFAAESEMPSRLARSFCVSPSNAVSPSAFRYGSGRRSMIRRNATCISSISVTGICGISSGSDSVNSDIGLRVR